MINQSEIGTIKSFTSSIADMIQGGALFITIEGNTVTWRTISKGLNLNLFQVGEKVSEKGVAMRAIAQKKVLHEKIPRAVYGTRLVTIATPIVNDQNEVIGCLSMVCPRLHALAAAFPLFSPVVANVFQEGAFLFMTDLEKVAYRQGSTKFDVPDHQIGDRIVSDSIADKVIRAKKAVLIESSDTTYAPLVSIAAYPMFDEDNNKELVAVFGIITPKRIANELMDISNQLENSLTNISATIEELSASAMEIHSNEQKLNASIKDILNLSTEINSASLFIKGDRKSVV